MSATFSGVTGACILAPLAFLFTGIVLGFQSVNFAPAPGGSTNTSWILVAGVVALLAGLVGFFFGAFVGCLVRWRSRAAPTRQPYLQAAVVGAIAGSAFSVVRVVSWLIELFEDRRGSLDYYMRVFSVWRPYLVLGLVYGILVALVIRSRLNLSGQGRSEPRNDGPEERRIPVSWAAVGSLVVIVVVAVVWAAKQEGKWLR